MKRTRRKKKWRSHLKPQSYVVVEEDDSEREEAPRGRLRLRGRESDASRRPSSPPPAQPKSRSSRPSRHYDSHDFVDGKVHSKGRRNPPTSYQGPPPSGFRYVQAPTTHPSEEPPPQRHTRRNSTKEPLFRPEEFSSPRRQDYGRVPPRSVFSREDSFGSSHSSRSHDSSRRRRERSITDDVFAHPPHNIHPQTGDGKVVVTETYVYRPRRQSREREAEGTRAFDEDRSRHSPVSNAKHNRSAEDHAYYQNNWIHEDSRPLAGYPGMELPSRRSYRRGVIQDSELYSEAIPSEDGDKRAC